MKKSIFILPSLLSLFLTLQSKAQFFTTDTIPVIIHVVHNSETIGTGHNLNQTQVMSQLNILNDDFTGQGWNVGNVPSVWASLIANTHIVFVPALVDTSGNLLTEPGIDRIDRNTKGWQNTATMNSINLQNYLNNTLKPQSIWDHSRYCNVWVLDMNASGLLGITTFPANSGLSWITGGTGTATTDGVCVHYKCWGDTLNVMAPYNHGRTATHEFGHWLGLPHMYAGCGSQVITDLPIGKYNQSFSSPVFPDVADTCGGYPEGPMFMNFMCNALNDSDVYMFSNGQSVAMKQSVANSYNSLKHSGVGTPTSVKSFDEETSLFTVFPNPGTDVVQVKSNVKNDEVFIRVYNTLGETVHEQILTNTNGSFSFDLSKQKKGIYFLEMSSAGKTSIQKIMTR